MAKKLKVWLNNKLNKRLCCTVVIKFYCIFITELVLTFFVFKCPNYFEFSKCGKRSPHLKILEIPGGRGVIKDPLEQKILGGWGDPNQRVFRGGGMDIFRNHTFTVPCFFHKIIEIEWSPALTAISYWFQMYQEGRCRGL